MENWMKYAAVMVIDDYPVYWQRQTGEFAIESETCEIHSVDGNGFMAMRAEEKDFTVAHSLRRHIHKEH